MKFYAKRKSDRVVFQVNALNKAEAMKMLNQKGVEFGEITIDMLSEIELKTKTTDRFYAHCWDESRNQYKSLVCRHFTEDPNNSIYAKTFEEAWEIASNYFNIATVVNAIETF